MSNHYCRVLLTREGAEDDGSDLEVTYYDGVCPGSAHTGVVDDPAQLTRPRACTHDLCKACAEAVNEGKAECVFCCFGERLVDHSVRKCEYSPTFWEDFDSVPVDCTKA